jgi:hypothetical protein
MSHLEVYNILGLLLQGQNSGVRLLEFSNTIPNSDVEAGPEISELPQPPITDREPPTSPRDVGTGSAAEFDNDISEISGSPGPARRTANSQPSPRDEDNNSSPSLLSASGACSASPVIEPPSQSSPPLSKSVTKVTIENVAEAGFLNIISDATAVDVPNQVLQHFETSQQGGNANTSNSITIKRGREEMEQGGQSEDKQTKKHRGRVIIPPRKQSSRYDRRQPTYFIAFTDVSPIASKTSTIRTNM